MTYKERYQSDPEFREEMKARSREHYHANKEAAADRRKKYYAENKEAISARRKSNYQKAKEADPEFLAKEAARQRERRANLSDAERAKINAQRKARGWNRGRKNRHSYAPRVRQTSSTKSVPKRSPKKVPSEVRAAWRWGKPNSVIRRKYPTIQALKKGAANGDFDHVKEYYAA